MRFWLGSGRVLAIRVLRVMTIRGVLRVLVCVCVIATNCISVYTLSAYLGGGIVQSPEWVTGG